ncbi:hypothetical protein, conserved [Eimeria necatrix]|uniref:Uncharacterized protein n=1 Tax=Eimeria necatrix TaxID=51315 RepID=U6MUH7_9EIME|nr:hypothetical protein, conserved [Eimeria necatrix]CDJ66738.1 hypothetical protein, conserved [Eimeria necatrix]
MQHYLLSLPPLLLLQLLLPSQLLLAAAALSLDLRKAAAPTVAAALGARTAAFDAEDGEEAIRLGAAAYSQLLKESSEEGAASSCWQQVSEQLLLLQQQTHEDACSSRGEAFRELIALTRMRCIYARSGRPFPGPAEGCYLFPHEVPLDWIGLHGQAGTAKGAAAVDAAVSHPCVKLNSVLQQVQQAQQLLQFQQMQQNLEGDWSEAYAKQQQQNHDQDEGLDDSTEELESESTRYPGKAAKTMDLMHAEAVSPLVQLRQLQQQQQQLYRRCIALTRRQTAACQQHSKMDFGTFALVREQINHIDNICFFLHSAERQRKTEEATVRLSAASAAATASMQQQLQHLEHMGKLQEQLQLQQLQGGNYMQQLLQQLQQGLEDSFAVLEQLKAFHKAVGEWLGGTETVALYLVAAAAALLLTSNRRVSGARLGVLGILSAAAAAEMALHHGGISPLLSQLTKPQYKPRSPGATEEGSSGTLNFLKEVASDAGVFVATALAAAAAAYGVSFVRWTCLVTCCWVWLHCFLHYTSPEQQMQQQLQQLQQQVCWVREELHEVQAAGDPRMQEVQQLLQQLLQRVTSKDEEMQRIQLQERHERQLLQQHQQQQQLRQPRQSLARRSLLWTARLIAPVLAAAFTGAVSVASWATAAAWRRLASTLNYWSFVRATAHPPASSKAGSDNSRSTREAEGSFFPTARSASSPLKRESSSSSRRFIWQQKGRCTVLPEGLREQSRKNNEDEGEVADPSYLPPTSSSSTDSDEDRLDATVPSDPNAPAIALSAAVSPSAHTFDVSDAAAAQFNPSHMIATKCQPQDKQNCRLPQRQQQQKPYAQPLRRNPVRACRVVNFAKLEDPQHPDVFMREVVPPERLKALQGQRRCLSSSPSTESSGSGNSSISSSSTSPADSRRSSPAVAQATPAARCTKRSVPKASASSLSNYSRTDSEPLKQEQRQLQLSPSSQSRKSRQK